MSVLIWADGFEWVTAVPKWPWGAPYRALARGWTASNGPHLVGEPQPAALPARVVDYGWDTKSAFLDLERAAPGTSVRRQIVSPQPGLWIVIDSVADPDGRTLQSVWTAPPNVHIERVGGATYTFRAPSDPADLDVQVLASVPVSVEVRRASLSPFAGWGVLDFLRATAADAIVLDASNDAGPLWTASVWERPSRRHDGGAGVDLGARMVQWSDPTRWRLTVGHPGDATMLERVGGEIRIRDQGGRRRNLALTDGPDVLPARASVRAAFERARDEYAFRPMLRWRAAVCALMLAALAVQERLFARARDDRRLIRRLSILAAGMWVLAGALWHVASGAYRILL
jgi:hypothetical protein